MPAIPWVPVAPVHPDAEYLIVATRFTLVHRHDLVRVLAATNALWSGFGHTAGVIGYTLSSHLARGTLATLSAWEEQIGPPLNDGSTLPPGYARTVRPPPRGAERRSACLPRLSDSRGPSTIVAIVSSLSGPLEPPGTGPPSAESANSIGPGRGCDHEEAET